MGEPVKIVDLARDLIRLSGFSEDEIHIEFSGIRPGEKLFEELSTTEEAAHHTHHPKILVGRTSAEGVEDIEHLLDRLVEAALQGASSRVKTELRRIVTDYGAPADAASEPLPSSEQHSLPDTGATSTTRITRPPGPVLPVRGVANGGAFGIGQ